ncbi:MAG: hypothetical protein IJU92_04625 [Spirochaetaceae bacterium]|nr:hypothetical protein [Spirochaetaceae bacterium]
MNSALIILFKKELYEFRYNIDNWILILISLLTICIPAIHASDARVFYLAILVLLSVEKYIFFTFRNEIEGTGGVFIVNTNVKFWESMLVKTLFSLCILCLMMIMSFVMGRWILSSVEFVWLVSLTMSISAISFCTVCFSKGSSNSASTISIIFVVVLIIITLLIRNTIAKLCVSIIVTAISFFIANSLSKSTYYRAQL